MSDLDTRTLSQTCRVGAVVETKHSSAWDAAADGLVLADALDFTLLMANSAFLEMAALDPADLPTCDLESVFEGDGAAVSRWAACPAEGRTGPPVEMILRVRTGERKPVEVSAGGLRLAQRPCVALVVRDFSESRQVEEINRPNKDEFMTAARDAHGALWDWDLRSGIIQPSDEWWRLLGYEVGRGSITLEEWQGHVHPEDREGLRLGLLAHLGGHTPAFHIELRMLSADHTPRRMLCRGQARFDDRGGPAHIVGSLFDISKSARGEPVPSWGPQRDTLTGLPNRAAFVDRLSAALERAHRRSGAAFAVLLLDLDRFSVINDSLGYRAGNDVLMAVARRLAGGIRSQDTVARLDGDEFAVLLENVGSVAEAKAASDRIRESIGSSLSLGEQEIYPSASIGIAMYQKSHTTPEEILHDAASALSLAKSTDRDRHVVVEGGLRGDALALLQLECCLRNAIGKQELRLVYQPILALDQYAVQGFEALIRWQHPTLGLLTPDQFLPLAEETGMIIPFGAWVLHEAALQARSWQAAFPYLAPLTVSVNISSRQFAHPDLVAQVESALAASGLEPGSLILEITESVLVKNVSDALGMLQAFASKGIRLALDDFGTGYSALSCLQRFPFAVLKIDPSFISRLAEDRREQAIVQAVFTLADNLGLEVVAEGVERHDQEQCLRELGCRFVQGYLYSRPMDPETATTWLQETAVGQAQSLPHGDRQNLADTIHPGSPSRSEWSSLQSRAPGRSRSAERCRSA